MSDLDALLGELRRIRMELASMGPDDPGRAGLEDRRDILHERARRRADLTRPTDEIRRELEMARSRLSEIDTMHIDPSFTERRQERWPVGNPTGYIQKINSVIEANTRDERAQLVARIAELAAILDDR